jgi:hypothetical protein
VQINSIRTERFDRFPDANERRVRGRFGLANDRQLRAADVLQIILYLIGGGLIGGARVIGDDDDVARFAVFNEVARVREHRTEQQETNGDSHHFPGSM